MLDITNTQHLLAAIEQKVPVSTFLRDRYFPANPAEDIFNTSEVLVEYKDGSKRMAPFVSPRKNGVAMLRSGYSTDKYAPANIAPKRPLYVDDLKKKGFGEALFSDLSPSQRQMALITKDMDELDEAISNREEWMAAQTMLTNGCVMHHHADKGDEYEEKEIRFYSGASNPAVYVPGVNWDQSGHDIIGDLAAIVESMIESGNDATEVVVGSDVADVILNDAAILKLLDVRNYDIGRVAPEALPGYGATVIARGLSFKGHRLDIISYTAKIENESGTMEYLLPANQIVVTTPGAGRTAYGCVTQVEQADGEFHSYPGRRVPHYVADASGNSREITLTAAPLMMPRKKNAFVSATVLS